MENRCFSIFTINGNGGAYKVCMNLTINVWKISLYDLSNLIPEKILLELSLNKNEHVLDAPQRTCHTLYTH